MWRKRKHSDFQAEIESHLQLEGDRLREDGLTAREAQAAARRAFGNRTLAEERFHESGRWLFWDHLLRDLRYAARLLARDPRFSVLAVLGLALGIGVSTAIFTLIDTALHSSEARPDAESFVGVNRIVDGRPENTFSYGEYRDYRDRAATLRVVLANSGRVRFLMGVAAGVEAEEVQGRFVSANFLSASGFQPALGRDFSIAEEQGGGAPAVMLDFRFWQQRFSSDPGVLGRSVTLNAHPVTIVGVADARQGTFDRSDFYLPLGLQPVLLGVADWLHDPGEQWLMLDARLQPGVSVKQAQAEMDVLAQALRQGAPARPGDRTFLWPGGGNPGKRRQLAALAVAAMIAVSMILLIACSNLANLLLARGVVRQREIGVRLSLGAGRARLVAQLLTESLLLALAGGAFGLVFSHWLAKAIILAVNEGPRVAAALRIEPRVMLYAIALSLATGLSFGLAPPLTATRTSLAQSLHADGFPAAGKGESRKLWSIRNVLVIVPLALSLMLLLAAGAALRRVQTWYTSGPRFDAARLIAASIRPDFQGYDQARILQFQENLRRRIAAMPGVISVALATAMPLANGLGWFPMDVAGQPASAGPSGPHTDYNVISPEFFETVGARPARGRAFTVDDREGSPPVAMVNQELARRYWPDQDPIGKRIRLAASRGTYFEVVGVAPDLEDADGPYNTVRPTVYVPQSQGALFLRSVRTGLPPYQMQFLARTAGQPAAVKAAIRQEVRAVDSSLRVNIQTVQEWFEERFGPVKATSMLLSALGGLAMLMASVGIYAILAYAVSRRTREIGIRTALGAQRREILALVMQRSAALIAWGIGLGLAAAVALTRIFAHNFAKMGELNAMTCLAVAALLAGFALLASYLPARKALRVDPVQALRCE